MRAQPGSSRSSTFPEIWPNKNFPHVAEPVVDSCVVDCGVDVSDGGTVVRDYACDGDALFSVRAPKAAVDAVFASLLARTDAKLDAVFELEDASYEIVPKLDCGNPVLGIEEVEAARAAREAAERAAAEEYYTKAEIDAMVDEFNLRLAVKLNATFTLDGRTYKITPAEDAGNPTIKIEQQ